MSHFNPMYDIADPSHFTGGLPKHQKCAEYEEKEPQTKFEDMEYIGDKTFDFVSFRLGQTDGLPQT